MIGIVDCNNFYASCERVFNPALRNKPVVVLSNNDGCIIARSNEAKAMGLKMGEPFYKVKDLLEKNGVAVFSSNYNLYGDMSRRVMMLLNEMTPGINQYSIDECFVDLSGIHNLTEFGKNIVKTIGKGTDIPVTMGIAPTHTLAKAASIFGKKYKGYDGVCIIDTEEKRVKALKLLEIGKVWGIGRRNAEKLRYYGINTAYDLTQKTEAWIRRVLTVTGVRTWKELNGTDCIDVTEMPRKQSICTSRSFPDSGLSDIETLEEAVVNFGVACSRKLRMQQSVCRAITVFAYTSRFRQDMPSHTINRTVHLCVPTNDICEISKITRTALRQEYKEGYLYKKAGVIVWNISGKNIQTDLFDPIDRKKQERLNKAIDEINRRNGYNTIKVAAQGTNKAWHLKCEHKTRQYTTNINEVIDVRV
ncbi:MAG: Y-family DNA polymerase [Prevotellaceae bacterium]|nr:Y-family DNA polymerase [Prevotellaceae bacterium]